jgi:hypothetical protein
VLFAAAALLVSAGPLLATTPLRDSSRQGGALSLLSYLAECQLALSVMRGKSHTLASRHYAPKGRHKRWMLCRPFHSAPLLLHCA